MKKILDCLKTYIDDDISMKNWNKEARKSFSLVIASLFNFSLINLLKTDFILLEPLEVLSVDKLEKNIRFIENKTGYPCVLLLKKISTYMLKRFLKEKIAFIVEDNQLSIPFLALKVRTIMQKQNRIDSIKRFTPLCQLIFLYLLYSDEKVFAIPDLTQKLSVSSMSILRAMNIFEDLGLVKTEIGGLTNRKKLYYRLEQKKFFEIGKIYLDNPIKKVLYVSSIPDKIKVYKSGLTALSDKTMLSEPKRKNYAIFNNEVKLRNYLISEEIASDTNSIIIHLMKYDISLLTQVDSIDPISLISGLNEKDERIETAILEMMADYKWFTE